MTLIHQVSKKGQPGGEPEIPSSQPSESQQGETGIGENPTPDNHTHDPAVNTPVPVNSEDDDLTCDHLLCIDDELRLFHDTTDLAWRMEVDVHQMDINMWREEADPGEMAFVASAAKSQRSEVRLSTLSHAEKEQFQKAKDSEISTWIKTGTISKILRSQMPPEQIL